MSDFIPLSVPTIKGNEWKYIKECLDSEWVSSAGTYVKKFEGDICRYTGVPHAVACVNGTSALFVALKLAGVSPQEEVIVPTLTFIAPVNAVHYIGACPVFMDCDEYYNIDEEKTVDFILKETRYDGGISFNKTTQKRIAAIIPVHIFGNAARMENLLSLCRERNIKIVEDATESLGTFYAQGLLAPKHTGTLGDIGCLSFNGNKIITTGGGGMIITRNPEYAKKAYYLTTQAKDDEIYYIHNEVGYNFRLTNIQAALGVAQLERLSEFLVIKKKNFETYKTQIDNIPGLHLAETPAYADNNYWMYALQINRHIYNKNVTDLMIRLARNNIQTRPVWHLNHRQKPYKGCQTYKIEKAPILAEKTLNIPSSVNLKSHEIQRVIDSLKK
jgi:aminotransferase in exopolysaccharide biosynthesis